MMSSDLYKSLEFAGRHNIRDLDTLEQMGYVSNSMFGKRLTYRMLIAGNAPSSGTGV